jgi:YtcA family
MNYWSKGFIKAWFLLASLLLTSCSRAPTFDVLGSYFPAWLFCLALGVVLTAAIRWLMLRLHIEFIFPILVYPSLTALSALALWLVFYS